MTLSIRTLALFLVAALVTAGCARTQSASSGNSPARSSEIQFSEDIQPLLQEKFAPLLQDETGLDLSSWESLMAGSDHGEVVIPYDAENSLLVELATKQDLSNVENAPTQQEIDLIRRWINEGAQSDAGEVPYTDAGPLLYVPNQGEALISVIDMENNLVIRTVDLTELGFSQNAKPHHVVVEPDGSYWYVSLINANRVLKFNSDNELVDQAEFEVPGMMALDPSGDRLWVGRSMSAVNPPKRIGVIDRSDMSVEEVGVFYPRPHPIAVDPSGTQVYSGSLAQNQIATVNTNTQEVELTSVEGPTHTFVQFAVAPEGGTMVTGGQISGQVLFFDTRNGPQPQVVDSLQIGGQPWHPVYTPDGSAIYFPNKTANTVTVVDPEKRAVDTVVEGRGLAQPHGSAVHPNGEYVYISNNNRKGAYTPRYDLGDNRNAGTVTVIDTDTREIVKIIEVEDYPTGLGVPAAQ